jgi:hypothetical protein
VLCRAGRSVQCRLTLAVVEDRHALISSGVVYLSG